MKTSEAVQGEAEAGFFSKNHDSISTILESQAECEKPRILEEDNRASCENPQKWIAAPCLAARLAMTEKWAFSKKIALVKKSGF
ncbi:hypothetical protein [Helicobacter zhangjianzhongii]|uniref:hypothetical protein n=1 Tax=Helicobacter zhangjianzhongii TaxID=2974574 RepID=UPI0025531825|nr:hypothetical protein [Helicobacter sp. CPD2-1]MDL0079074.1 hypothetical protein [Helicobacter sp. CPD2-1]